MRPLDEYTPGVRAPGEAYTGPIADPVEAVRGYMAFMAEGGGLGKVDADPYAPIKAYLSAKPVWENPGKYAGWPRPEPVTPMREPDASAPSPAPLHDPSMRDDATLTPTVVVSAPGTTSDVGPSERPDLAVIRAQYQAVDDRMVKYRPFVGSTPIPSLNGTSIPGLRGVDMTATEANMFDALGPFRKWWFYDVRRRAYGVSEDYVPTPDDVVYPPGLTTDGAKQYWLGTMGTATPFATPFGTP